MLHDSLEVAAVALTAAQDGPREAPASAQAALAKSSTKGLTASAFISAPPDEAGAARTLEQILETRGWKTERELKHRLCGDDPDAPLADPLACQSFVFAVLGRSSEASRLQAERIEAAKLAKKPIVPIVLADWEAMPAMAKRLAGYRGLSFLDKTPSEQNEAVDTLLNEIETKVLVGGAGQPDPL